MTVFLCGFMGCGKSASGRELAAAMGKNFIDMDDYIVKKEGKTIPEIFAENGEDHFRRAETEAVRSLSETGAVVACGGGAMLKSENAKIANEKGIVVYLEETFENCYSRISGDKNRPIVMNNTKEGLLEIYNGRAPLYEKNSRVKIVCRDTPKATAKEIADNLKIFR